jgi:hypothetical protein
MGGGGTGLSLGGSGGKSLLALAGSGGGPEKGRSVMSEDRAAAGDSGSTGADLAS